MPDAFDFDTRSARDNEREPTRLRTPRKVITFDPRGSLRMAMERHGETCDCRWCTEQPETEAALDVLRQGGLL